MDSEEERAVSPVSSLIENEAPSPIADDTAERNGMLRSVSGIGAELMYSKVNYTISMRRGKKKEILKNCSGIMGPGVNAILGPTGSGKTTLLGILAGRCKESGLEGDILVNGEPRKKSFRLQCGFVVQDDVVMGTLTVRENLAFSAALRLSSEFTSHDRKARVEMIIEDLGLKYCADTRVGTDERRGISGGERKRTSIGMELIIAPNVLFLDEPTTGLDATTAHSVVKLLQRQSFRGRTVIFSIHQPRYSIFKLFDTLTLLSNGETVFHGPCNASIKYFSSLGYQCETYNNPADFYMDVIMEHENSCYVRVNDCSEVLRSSTPETVYDKAQIQTRKSLPELYKDSSYYKETCMKIQPVVDAIEEVRYNDSGKKIGYQSSFCKQMRIVANRVVKNLIRDPRAFSSQLMVKMLYAFIIGGLYFQLDKKEAGLQNRNGVMFFLIINSCFPNISAIAVFMKERRIFRHEVANGYYRVSSYFLSKVLCDLLPMRVLPLFIFSAIVYNMVGFKNEATSYLIFTLILFLSSLAAVSLCLLVSSSVQLIAVANLFVSVPFVFMMLFSGFLIRLQDVPVWLRWIKWLSIFRYGLSGLQLNELHGMKFSQCGENHNTTCLSGDQYLGQQGLEYPKDMWESCFALGAIAVILLTLTYIQLRRMPKIS